MSPIISAAALRELIDVWIKSGKQVAAPVSIAGRLLYQRIDSSGQAVLDSALRPANSIKDFVFPRHERLFGYRIEGRQISLTDPKPEERDQIVIGAKPCDAHALPILDHVFAWGSNDEPYERGRRRTAIVALACTAHDDACFCTSVGSSPADETGADAMLFDLGNGSFELKAITAKGRTLFTQHAQPPATEPRPSGSAPAPRFDPAKIRAFLATQFESPFWAEGTLACLGCGACAYTCPTCHCFDIVDEGSAAEGARVRNWDSCQFPLFTAHASGHNPRSNQAQRQRQRMYHKFAIYPEKFGAILCTGCGNCARNCPAGLGVLGVLEAIDRQTIKTDERQPVQT